MKIKNIISILAISMALAACKKENTPDKVQEKTVISANDQLLSMGNFIDGGRYKTSGKASLYNSDDKLILEIKDFSTNNGPDLRVYLAKDKNARDFIDLGKLKAVNGTFNYETAKRTDIADFKEVLIWCEDFSVLFGSAELK